MNSKQAIAAIEFNARLEQPIYSLYYHEYIEPIEKDLEILEKLEAKTHLLYKDRKAIAKEFDKWCENNDAVNCSENMVTWFLSIKLKEWLEDGSL